MRIGDAILATLVVVLGAAGTFLMLPHRHGTARPRKEYGAGAISASLGLLVFLSFWSPPGPVLPTLFFYVFSVAAITGGLLTVTSRNPIYSALWFASVVLATAGLFLLAGAPFLAAGTVIVYAGAIIVTFLFVIMLAQMEGKAPYDRAARSPGPATFTCFLLLWSLIYALAALKTQPTETAPNRQGQLPAESSLYRSRDLYEAYHMENVKAYGTILNRTLPPTKPNVAGLGESLYTVHLITVGLAGVLLFVALVGAVAITNPRRPHRG
ncbi:MAG TPA: NADH-quinone oxidoreductase subunit J [Isosphaeraceae bacterium]|nr:NADH-quinone oxidoreductase subunit J [Isosphaeraceae bacterium]